MAKQNKYMTKDIWHLNKRQIRKTKNIMTWEDEKVCQAHTSCASGFDSYVPQSFAQKLIDALKEISETGNAEIATTLLENIDKA